MISWINVSVQPSKTISPDIELILETSFRHLAAVGFVIPVIVQTPSALCEPPALKALKTITVMALLDTGASRTFISVYLQRN